MFLQRMSFKVKFAWRRKNISRQAPAREFVPELEVVEFKLLNMSLFPLGFSWKEWPSSRSRAADCRAARG